MTASIPDGAVEVLATQPSKSLFCTIRWNDPMGYRCGGSWIETMRYHQITARVFAGVIFVCAGSAPAQTSSALPRAESPPAQVVNGQLQQGLTALRYRVNYRPAASDPWQLYAETRSLAKANSLVSGVRNAGYQTEVVSDLTPSPQPYPDALETSASRYYPTSNWANDYN